MTDAGERAREIVSEHDDVLSDYPAMRQELIADIAAALTALETANAELRRDREKTTYEKVVRKWFGATASLCGWDDQDALDDLVRRLVSADYAQQIVAGAKAIEERDALKAEVERLRRKDEEAFSRGEAFVREWGGDPDDKIDREDLKAMINHLLALRAATSAEAVKEAELAMHVAQRYIRAGEGQPPYFDRLIPTVEQLDHALVAVRAFLAAYDRAQAQKDQGAR